MIQIINGPNLNLLGKREVGIYGKLSFEEYLPKLKEELDLSIEYYQSNIEGEIVNKIQEIGFDQKYMGVVINAASYSHTSIAIRDAIAAIDLPVVEVHISNVFTRETFRQHSYLSAVCVGIISGFGLEGYRLAVDYLRNPSSNDDK